MEKGKKFIQKKAGRRGAEMSHKKGEEGFGKAEDVTRREEEE